MSVSFLVLPSFFLRFFKFYNFLNPSFLPLLCPVVKKMALILPFFFLSPCTYSSIFFALISLHRHTSPPFSVPASYHLPPLWTLPFPSFLVILLAFRLHVLRLNHLLFLLFLILLRFPSVICPFHVPRPFLYIISLCLPTFSSLRSAFHLYTSPFTFPPSVPFISFITSTPPPRLAPPCHCSSSVAVSF